MAKKKKARKRNFTSIFIVFVILVIIAGSGYFGIKYYKYIQTFEYKLKEIGYSKEEITTITNKLNDKEIEALLDKQYYPNLIKFINQKYFIYSNLDRYQNYYIKNSEKTIEDIISIVNVEADNEFYTNVKEADMSKGNLILVNKFYKLPNDYAAEDLKPITLQFAYSGHQIKEEVLDHYLDMAYAAKKEGLTLIVTSSYRDYDFQKTLYNNYVNKNGKKDADRFSARPRHSEHELGLALDIVTYNTTMDEFEQTEEFRWLNENAYKYGFILRYPKEKEHITGYKYEPWHYRYVGVEYAKKIYDEGITFDEYYAYYLK